MKKVTLLVLSLMFVCASGFAAVSAGNKMCPVSNDPVKAGVTADYQDKTYAFCCKSCKKKFVKEPAKYVTSSASEALPVAEKVVQGTLS